MLRIVYVCLFQKMAEDFEKFYTDLKETEKADSQLTNKQQIDRLLRPGSTYLNLNPFEVLQIDPDTDIEQAKKRYKRLSVLIHPDKNPEDRERADMAFDIVKKAIKQMENPKELALCKESYEEAKARLAIIIGEKRRKAKKEGKEEIEEDEPAAYRKALWIVVTKVFADREKKRKALEERANEEKRRKAEEAQEAAEKRKLAEEFAKNYEETRDERRGSWRNFQTKKAKKEEAGKSFKGTAFRPPKQRLDSSKPTKK